MGEGDAVAAATKGSRPTITVPPRAPVESFFPGGSVPGFSPGPMTLVSNFFSPDSNSCSFSQLLAGAMASPIVRPGFPGGENYGGNEGSKEGDFGDGNDNGSGGYKQNRPMGLMVPQSPMFYIPPGLSPASFLNSPGFLSPLQSPFGMSHQQALAHVTAQAAFNQSFTQMQADYQRPSAAFSMEVLEPQPSSMPNTLQQKDDTTTPLEPHSLQIVEASHFEKKPTSFAGDKPSNDGYNWRKYGQKLVKAKENPRSYYKCTYSNCPVKKKVERAPDGHITEVTYKGQHNHDLPQPNARSKNSQAKDGSTVQNQLALEIVNRPQTAPSQSIKQELSTQLSTDQLLITNEHDEIEDSAVVIDEDNDDDEPDAKRRSTEIGGHVPVPSFKTVTEPKIVVQTRSEVDLLDDGYKWRKYGQKVVKGNSHPRSYYRCTYPGCNVRKHVERASTDPKAVITTYEGKHNHDILIARSGSNGAKSQKVMPVKPTM